MYEVMQVIGCILITMGFIEILRLLTLFFVKPKEKQGWILAIPVKGHRESVEYQIRSAASQIKRSDRGVVSVVVVDCGMDEETLQISRRVCQRIKGAEIVEIGRLDRWMESFPSAYSFTN